MDFYDLINKRRSIRKYSPKPIEEDKLKRILNAAYIAPTAKNLQPFKFLVVKNKEKIEKITSFCKKNTFMKDAPIVIVGLANKEESYQILGSYTTSEMVDLAIAMDHLILAATNEGLGTCWIASFEEDKLRNYLKTEEPYRIVLLTPIGYPLENPEPQPKKKFEEIFEFI